MFFFGDVTFEITDLYNVRDDPSLTRIFLDGLKTKTTYLEDHPRTRIRGQDHPYVQPIKRPWMEGVSQPDPSARFQRSPRLLTTYVNPGMILQVPLLDASEIQLSIWCRFRNHQQYESCIFHCPNTSMVKYNFMFGVSCTIFFVIFQHL